MSRPVPAARVAGPHRRPHRPDGLRYTALRHPRPSKGIFVALIVIVSTFADRSRLSM